MTTKANIITSAARNAFMPLKISARQSANSFAMSVDFAAMMIGYATSRCAVLEEKYMAAYPDAEILHYVMASNVGNFRIMAVDVRGGAAFLVWCADVTWNSWTGCYVFSRFSAWDDEDDSLEGGELGGLNECFLLTRFIDELNGMEVRGLADVSDEFLYSAFKSIVRVNFDCSRRNRWWLR